MSGSAVAQVLGLVLSGSSSNWWGLACPAHCSSSVGILLVVWVSGFSVGALVATFYLRVLLFAGPASAVHPHPVQPVYRGTPPSTASRLAAYRA